MWPGYVRHANAHDVDKPRRQHCSVRSFALDCNCRFAELTFVREEKFYQLCEFAGALRRFDICGHAFNFRCDAHCRVSIKLTSIEQAVCSCRNNSITRPNAMAMASA